MKEIVSTISSKGQVTVPVEIRKHLGIRQGDKISFVIEDGGGVRIQTTQYGKLASLRGAAGSLKQPKTWEEIIKIAHEDRANEIYDNK